MAWKRILLEGDAAVLSDVAPVDVDFLAAAAGAATEASRQDHKHDVPEALVGDLVVVDGGAAAVGTANKFVRADHKHALGPLVANLDFDQHQAVGLILHAVDAAPDAGTEVEGQIYFDTGVGDKHPYVWVP
ncbi:MAG: hypothetical protein ACOC58_00030 [Chloroflexota bacterium]